MSSTKTYDVAIIGSGPGGYVAAIRAAQLGMSVLIVERESRLGGVCTLRGCIPTKALLHTADLLEEARHGADVGVSAREVRLDLAGAMKHKEKVVRQSSNGVSYLMKKNRVDVAAGFGRLAGAGRVSVTAADGSETALFGEKHALSPRARRRASLPGIEIDHKTILSSDSILELTEVPKSLLVIGSGAVGVEFASMFARFGSKATILEVLPRIVPIEDEDISRELAASFKRQGMAVYVDARVERVTKSDGGVEVLARTSAEKTETMRAEKVLLAVGRKPLSEGIGLESAGVETERGYIKVDKFMRTNVPGRLRDRGRRADAVARARRVGRGRRGGRAHGGPADPAAQLRPGARLHVLLAGGRVDRPDGGERRGSAATTSRSASSPSRRSERPAS